MAKKEKTQGPPEVVFTQGQDALNLLRKEGVAFNLAAANIDSMTDREVNVTLFSYLDNINSMCWRRIRMGGIHDGGYEVCDDLPVRPVPPCTIYSFGINKDFTFDDDISKLYGCHVYAFDPSNGLGVHNHSSHVHFYNWGIGAKTEYRQDKKWQMYTMKDMREKLGHTNTKIDFIKLDVELSEWDALPDLIATDQFKDVKQFFVEYHFYTHPATFRDRLKAVQGVERVGLKTFYVYKNYRCVQRLPDIPIEKSFCIEVMYQRV